MTKTKPFLFVTVILIISSTIFSFVLLNNDFLIRKWNIPLSPPGYFDSRQMAMAAESYAQGYDPLIDNPINPTNQKLNYPRIWQLVFALGIDQGHTNLIGNISVLIFFIGVGLFWFSNKFDNRTYLFLSIAILSPAIMLAIERGNIELILFFVLALALTVNNYSNISALFIFVFASILKIYPVFGFLYLLNENKKKFWIFILSASGLFIFYMLLTLDDFRQVYISTPKNAGSSFGINVWWMGLRHKRFFDLPLSDGLMYFFKIMSYATTFVILGSTLFFRTGKKVPKLYRQGKNLIAFRVGAGIYIGCFLVMNTIDYRLMFLIFTIPQLLLWLRGKEKGFFSVPLVTLITIIFSLWNAFIMRFLGRKVTFVLEEFSNWIILAGLLYLFFCSLPNWVRDYFQKPRSITQRE